MARICVLIGEGKSEKAFFSSLLQKKFSFVETDQRNCIAYQSTLQPDLFWIFPVRSYGVTHSGGYHTLQKKSTFIDAKFTVANFKWLFGDNPEIHYRILVDTDNKTDEEIKNRCEEIEKAIMEANLVCSSSRVFITHIEIESWFLAGMTTSFPFLHSRKDTEISKIAVQDINKIPTPKETLNSILEDVVSGNTLKIAQEFGEHIDVDLARSRSTTFDLFHTSLEQDSLL